MDESRDSLPVQSGNAENDPDSLPFGARAVSVAFPPHGASFESLPQRADMAEHDLKGMLLGVTAVSVASPPFGASCDTLPVGMGVNEGDLEDTPFGIREGLGPLLSRGERGLTGLQNALSSIAFFPTEEYSDTTRISLTDLLNVCAIVSQHASGTCSTFSHAA